MRRQEDRQDETLGKSGVEEPIEEHKPDGEIDLTDIKKPVQDLQMHQVELEIYNQELKKAQDAMEESRCADLYDFAPVAYFTFDRNGMVKEANLAGAEMLGLDRKTLIGCPFSRFVDVGMRDAFSGHCSEALRTGKRLRCELALKNNAGVGLWVAVESVSWPVNSAIATVQSALLDITVESRPGKGSTFHVFFPSMPSNKADRSDKEGAIPHGKASLLFVDDEEILVEMNKARLGRLGYQVTATTSSLEALKLFRGDPFKFDLLITDFTMPHMTGVDLAKEVLKIRKDFPIILCTGVGEETVVQAARAVGIEGFLPKPITVREIASLIVKLLPPVTGASRAVGT